MRKAIVLLALVGLCGTASANLLVNGGFETGDLTGWSLIDYSGGGTFVTDADPYEGVYNLQPGANDRIYQIVDGAGISGVIQCEIESKDSGSTGQKYDITFYGLDAGYTLGSSGRPDSGHTELLRGADVFLLADYGLYYSSDGGDGDGVWDVDTGAGYDSLMVYIWFNGVTEVQAYDAITLTPEPASLSLLGLGAGSLLLRRRR